MKTYRIWWNNEDRGYGAPELIQATRFEIKPIENTGSIMANFYNGNVLKAVIFRCPEAITLDSDG